MAKIVQIHDGVVINKYALGREKMVIGRDPDCDIFIDDKTVSLEHAVVEYLEAADKKAGGQYHIRDMKSTNSTFVNDKEVHRKKLKNNDMIRIGWSTFKFIDEGGGLADKTLKIHKSWIPGVYYTKE